jgi:hypothetical protein
VFEIDYDMQGSLVSAETAPGEDAGRKFFGRPESSGRLARMENERWAAPRAAAASQAAPSTLGAVHGYDIRDRNVKGWE